MTINRNNGRWNGPRNYFALGFLNSFRQQNLHQLFISRIPHRIEIEGNLEDFLQVILRTRNPLLLYRSIAVLSRTMKGRVLLLKRMQQPSEVHANHDDEQWDRQQKMDCLQHLHHLGCGTAIQIVNVENNPAHFFPTWLPVLSCLPFLRQISKTLEVASYRRDDAEML